MEMFFNILLFFLIMYMYAKFFKKFKLIADAIIEQNKLNKILVNRIQELKERITKLGKNKDIPF